MHNQQTIYTADETRLSQSRQPVPRIDVFIPVYNDLAFVPDAINSALGQTGVDARVIVSDNASSDGTYEWLLDKARNDDRVIVHRNATNIGLIGNLNRYRDLVVAQHYMLLCSDDRLQAPDALAKAAAVVKADPSIASVYCDLAYIDGHGRTIANRRFRRQGRFSETTALRHSICQFRNLFGIPLLNNTAVHRDLAYPDGLTYTGDVYLSMLAARHGPIHHIPEILIGNRFTGRNMTAQVFAESRVQFARLAAEFGIELGRRDRVVQQLTYLPTMLSKKLFLSYVRWRS